MLPGRRPVLWKVYSVTRQYPFRGGEWFDGSKLSELPVDDMTLMRRGSSATWLLVALVERSLLSAILAFLCYGIISIRKDERSASEQGGLAQ